jgi:hypothetical protein
MYAPAFIFYYLILFLNNGYIIFAAQRTNSTIMNNGSTVGATLLKDFTAYRAELSADRILNATVGL